jgi:hypothetical protein
MPRACLEIIIPCQEMPRTEDVKNRHFCGEEETQKKTNILVSRMKDLKHTSLASAREASGLTGENLTERESGLAELADLEREFASVEVDQRVLCRTSCRLATAADFFWQQRE